MKFATNLSLGVLGQPDSEELWSEVIDKIDIKPNMKFLNVASGHGTEAKLLARKLVSSGFYNKEEAISSIYLIDKYDVFCNQTKLMGFKNVIEADFLEYDFDMKFDVVIGNPPYQDGTKKGGQNKIYIDFCKKAISISEVIAFITPTSVLKKSKRFSLIGQLGLKSVDFTSDNYFDVGVPICSWIIDKSYNGSDVSVYDKEGMNTQSLNCQIHDYSKNNKDFVKLYETLKLLTKKPKHRMFKQNPVDATNGRSSSKDDIFCYPVHKLNKGEIEIVQFNKPKPKNNNELKFVVSITKALNENACVISKLDFDVAHMHYPISSKIEADNIKSFILSDTFKEHSNKWKQLDGYGFNSAIKHLPAFDVSKKWTEHEVREFLESFVENNS